MNTISTRWRMCANVALFVAVMLVIVAGCPRGTTPSPEDLSPDGTPADQSPDDGNGDVDGADDGNGGDDGADDGGPDDDGGTDGDGSPDDAIDGDPPSGPQETDELKVAFTFDVDTLDGAYLMTFHVCDGDEDTCSDPRNHEVYLASSDDGLTWTVPDGWEPYNNSVPDVVERDDVLYIYTPNDVVYVDMATGDVSEPLTVELEDSDLSAGFVDPSPILDDEGRIVLFFVAGDLDGNIGTCADGETTCTTYVYSATETDDRDGLHFTVDAGARAEIDIDTSSDLKTATDPDIYFDGTQFVLYVSHGPSMTVWTSPTLLGSYTLVATLPDGLLTYGIGGVGSGIYDETGTVYWTYAHATVDGTTVIRRATHADFSTQLVDGDFTILIEGADLSLSDDADIASPGVWKRE